MADTPLESLRAGKAPLGMRMAIADGLMPLEGDELVEALAILTQDDNPKVLSAMKESLPTMPRGFLTATAQHVNTPPDLIHFMAHVLTDDEEIMQALILNRSVSDDTLIFAAETAPPAVLEILAQNRNRMLECPAILANLIENPNLTRVSRFALDEFRERFQIDLDMLEAEEILAEAGDDAVAVDDVASDADVALDEAVAEEIDEAGLTDTAEIELDGLPDTLEEEDLEDVDVQADEYDEDEFDDDDDEYEDAEEDFEEDLTEIKGFDSGWDIDELVKEVAGDDESIKGSASDGFDDLLDITVMDDDDDEKSGDSWLGDDISDLASDLDIDDEEDDDEQEEEMVDTRIRLMKMSAADKLILAQMGTKQERAILVTDPNKKVAIAVVEGPKMSEYEIQRIASNRQVYEEVLRAISKHREWGKSPLIRRELVLNPKTPLAIATRMLPVLNEYILKDVAKSKDLPNALVNQAKRVLSTREKRRGG